MTNISRQERERMLSFLKKLRSENQDTENIKLINEIEQTLTDKKYGLVWEEHSETVDKELKTKIPVFNEVEDKKLLTESKNYNFLLEGDNLHSLKLLEKTHTNQIDVIYIDPPYNTENSLTYDDKRVSSTDSYRHSKWLSFMERRLKIARKLLNTKGLIFISIDDNEAYQLKLLCDEIFNESNFMGSFSVTKAEGGGRAKYIIKGHDLLLVYAKDLEKANVLAKAKDVRGRIIDIDGVQYWIQEDAIRETYGAYGNLHYEDILRFRDQKFKDEIDQGIEENKYKLIKKENGKHVIGKLRRLDTDYSKFHSVMKHLNAEGKHELESFGLSELFDYPKPVSLIQEIIEAATFFPKDHYTILDFFAGSGTTGEAVINANKKDGKNRTFILCTNNEVSSLQKLNFCKSKGYVESYNATSLTSDSAIMNRINKELVKENITFEELVDNNRDDYESFGICQSVTYPRLKMIHEGYISQRKTEKIIYTKKLTPSNIKNGDVFIEEIDKIKKDNEYSKYRVSIKDNNLELTGITNVGEKVDARPFNLKYFRTGFISKSNEDGISESLLTHTKELIELENNIDINEGIYALLLTEEELNDFIENNQVREYMTIYISTDILLTKKQQELFLSQNVTLKPVPRYYFSEEMKEVGEL